MTTTNYSIYFICIYIIYISNNLAFTYKIIFPRKNDQWIENKEYFDFLNLYDILD